MIRPFFVSLTLFGLLLSVRVWGYEFTHLTKDNNGLSYDGIRPSCRTPGALSGSEPTRA